MGQVCTICSHPKRNAIDKALASKQSQRAIAGQFKVPRSNLQRHADHLPVAVAEAEAAREAGRAKSLAEQVHEQVIRCHQRLVIADEVLEAARLEPELACKALQASSAPMRDLRGFLELLGKLTGELATGPTAVAIAGAQATATSAVETQLQALTDEELAEELRAALEAVEARIAAKGTA